MADGSSSYWSCLLYTSEIWAEFTGSSGRVIRREAYWDGGRTYCVSFAPTELGVWNYVIEAPEQKMCIRDR